MNMALTKRFMKNFKKWGSMMIIFVTPILLLPLPIIVPTLQSRCAYVVILLTIYWISEAIPYSVTSLLPLALFPLAGVLRGDQVGLNYFKDTKTLFLGSMTLAQALEHVHLDRRIGLFVVSLLGSSIKWSMAGIMVVTAFLSMWINNSAATSIMMPTALAITQELRKNQTELRKHAALHRNRSPEQLERNSSIICQNSIETSSYQKPINEGSSENSTFQSNCTHINSIPNSPAEEIDQPDNTNLQTGYLIAVAYSSALGGLASLVGTGPNIFVKAFADDYYNDGPHKFTVSFTNFLLFALPIGLVLLILCWLWLQFLYNRQDLLPWTKKSPVELEAQKALKSTLKNQYNDLGPLQWQQMIISILFALMLILWITRDFSTSPGWEIIFYRGYVTDGTIALLIGCLAMILPNENPWNKGWQYHPILPWDQLSKKFPWGVFMLQGAGLAIADAFKQSDLSGSIADFLKFIVGTSDLNIIAFTILISAIFTEFTSNLACASILFPILDSIAKSAEIHAARLILPSCLAVSLSFMLPIATPPNAMIFTGGNMRIIDLIRAGIGMKIIGSVIILIASMTLISPIFKTHQFMSRNNLTHF